MASRNTTRAPSVANHPRPLYALSQAETSVGKRYQGGCRPTPPLENIPVAQLEAVLLNQVETLREPAEGPRLGASIDQKTTILVQAVALSRLHAMNTALWLRPWNTANRVALLHNWAQALRLSIIQYLVHQSDNHSALGQRSESGATLGSLSASYSALAKDRRLLAQLQYCGNIVRKAMNEVAPGLWRTEQCFRLSALLRNTPPAGTENTVQEYVLQGCPKGDSLMEGVPAALKSSTVLPATWPDLQLVVTADGLTAWPAAEPCTEQAQNPEVPKPKAVEAKATVQVTAVPAPVVVPPDRVLHLFLSQAVQLQVRQVRTLTWAETAPVSHKKALASFGIKGTRCSQEQEPVAEVPCLELQVVQPARVKSEELEQVRKTLEIEVGPFPASEDQMGPWIKTMTAYLDLALAARNAQALQGLSARELLALPKVVRDYVEKLLKPQK